MTSTAISTASRKQRLRTLENSIRKAAEQIQKNGLEIGRYLCEIRDDELWAEGYPSWNQYLKAKGKELVGKSFSQSANLIKAAEIHKRLPQQVLTSGLELPASSLSEIGRLAPHSGKEGAEKDYSKLRKQDVSRVLNKAKEHAGDSKVPSVRDIRKAVDEDLGIDRAAKAKETREQADEKPKLEDYLESRIGIIEGVTANLADVPPDTWKLLEESGSQLATRLATACGELAELAGQCADEFEPDEDGFDWNKSRKALFALLKNEAEKWPAKYEEVFSKILYQVAKEVTPTKREPPTERNQP